MHILVKQIFRIFQKLSCNNNSCCCAVANLSFLGFCNLNNHLCAWMLNLHLFKNCHAVICDSHISYAVNNHLVHSLWAKSCSHSLCHYLGSHDICSLSVSSNAPLCAFRQNKYWLYLICHSYSTSRFIFIR